MVHVCYRCSLVVGVKAFGVISAVAMVIVGPVVLSLMAYFLALCIYVLTGLLSIANS